MLTFDESAVRNYLAPPLESPWSWRDDGETVAWNDGPTIAFRAEIEAVLRRVAPRGLPPFGAVLWLLGACRDGEAGRRAVSELGSQFDMFRKLLSSSVVSDNVVFVGLENVRQLPVELRVSVEAKATLAEMVFEHSGSSWTPAVATKIVAALSRGLSQAIVATHEDSARTLHLMLSELQALRGGLSRITPEALKARRRTGVEQEVLPAPINIEPVQSVRDLLAKLRNDPELSGIARLAQHLMVVTQLPRRVADPDELPMGGVSDITNRGDWDKLLLSELAHDDLTLTARLANNEALFLRREIPPRPPQRCQAVLVDTGLRMWGVPRVFAAAVALAFAATADKQTFSRTWHLLDDDDVEPVDLTTRDGLNELLAALEMSRHPGNALPELLLELEDAASAEARSATPLDAVLITTDDVLADREFQRSLDKLPRLTLYLATVNRAGEFRLRVHSPRGTKLLREARLSLDELLSSPQPAVPLIDPNVDPKLPAILRQRSFPLRLSLPPLANAFWPAPNGGAFSISGNGCLLFWTKRGQGGQLLSDRIPKGDLLWYGEPNHDGVSRAVIGAQAGPLHLLTIDADHNVTLCQISETRRHPVTDVAWHRDRLFLFELASVELVDPRDGRLLSKKDLPKEDQRRCGRFYLADGQWRATSHDGHQFVAQVLCREGEGHDGEGQKPILAVIEPSGLNGPVLLFNDLTLRTQDGTETVFGHGHSLSLTRTLVAASADGLRFHLTARPRSRDEAEWRLLVSFPDKKIESLRPEPNWRARLEPEASRAIRPACVRNQFDGVGVVDGVLCLRNAKGNNLSLEWQGGSGMIWRQTRNRLRDTAGDVFVTSTLDPPIPALTYRSVSAGWLRFHGLSLDHDQRFLLSEAVFAEGSRVILDSRGLLHCQSSDPSIPEFTLVLIEGQAAGWCANGTKFGNSYFFGSETGDPPRPFFDQVLQPFLRRLT